MPIKSSKKRRTKIMKKQKQKKSKRSSRKIRIDYKTPQPEIRSLAYRPLDVRHSPTWGDAGKLLAVDVAADVFGHEIIDGLDDDI
jgi:hypothetical protein